MSNGLKSLAKELPKHGRYGDTIVAHINAQEAALLKALGGSGTINPTTGLPEFWGGLGALNPFNPGSTVGKIVQQVPGVKETQNLATQVFQPIEKAVVQPASNALVQVDKAVGKMIPGGWGTVGMVAGSMMGLPTYAMVGLGALNGSGVMHPGRKFNMQGALMGGAMAYGMSQLGEYARAASGDGTTALTEGVTKGPELLPGSMPADASELGNITPEVAGPVTNASTSLPPTIDSTPNLTEIADIRATQPGLLERAGNYIENIPNAIGESTSSGIESLKSGWDTWTTPSNYGKVLENAGENIADTSKGIGNILSGNASPAAAEAVKAGAITSPAMAGAATIYGAMGVSDVEAQQQYLKDQLAAGNIAQAEYNAAMAEIERSANIAREAVKNSPFSTTPSRDVSIGETYYGRNDAMDSLYGRGNEDTRLYAVGGQVDDENGMDEARGLMQGNMQNGFMGGGVPSYADGGMMPSADLALRGMSQPAFNDGAVGGMQRFAEGGSPRFLSGGGDGMSDSIPATIDGKQEARLADGEFVIPADVVSHLGNGSSKAGAKQLYSMMNKVRAARTGNPKQGKQINPRKYLPA